MDILTVREATKFAADYARSGKVTHEMLLQLFLVAALFFNPLRWPNTVF